MYNHTWKKYLPVIRLLLKKSNQEDQRMTLNRTDFERTSKLRKPVCSFDVEIVKGRLDRVNTDVQVKSLMSVLTEDSATMGILRQGHYAINLNSDFQLSIRNTTPAATPVPAEEA
ncbi:MAG: hypothetical protein IPG86_04710 [Chitinophagaceae bacterium]|nr:hypothetical protein [Chitinophagaceae bacterium]